MTGQQPAAVVEAMGRLARREEVPCGAGRARLAGIYGNRDVFSLGGLEDRRRTLARFRPDLDFRIIEGAGHWVPYEAPALVNGALQDILGGGGPPAGR